MTWSCSTEVQTPQAWRVSWMKPGRVNKGPIVTDQTFTLTTPFRGRASPASCLVPSSSRTGESKEIGPNVHNGHAISWLIPISKMQWNSSQRQGAIKWMSEALMGAMALLSGTNWMSWASCPSVYLINFCFVLIFSSRIAVFQRFIFFFLSFLFFCEILLQIKNKTLSTAVLSSKFLNIVL